MKPMVFIIRPIRNCTPELAAQIEELRKTLEPFFNVYDPARNTPQTMNELAICTANREAMREADLVAVVWDGQSQGVLFDLGMAFALGKTIVATSLVPDKTEAKSFTNLIHTLNEEAV